MARHIGPEAAKNLDRREREGFFENYLFGDAILDIGYKGEDPESQPITDKAIGIDLDYPCYAGKSLPFPDMSQDAVFASHVLEHIEDWAASLADWYRVLKIGGYMVIAVPHRDLYERKPALPSRFNTDHKRFYTPASLLNEVEEALPAGGYRIRSLKDVDEGFDYTIPPDRHAVGCYEIELVLQKIMIPVYAKALRPSPIAGELSAFYAKLVVKALRDWRCGQLHELKHIQEILSGMPLLPFFVLEKELQGIVGMLDQRAKLVLELREILQPVLEQMPFDENWYLGRNPDVAKALLENRITSPRAHFIRHGYFEGRASHACDRLFG
jgi:SAM-dependent methyltransferase